MTIALLSVELTEDQIQLMEQQGIRNIEHLAALMADVDAWLTLTQQLSLSAKQLEKLSNLLDAMPLSAQGYVELPPMGLIEEKDDE